MLNLYSTRLFPKNKGADRYQITGIASKCDWVVLSDHEAPQTHLRKKIKTDHPKSIFLSLRAPSHALKFFATQILPEISSPFILVSGSEDITIPNQMDQRWPPFDQSEKGYLETILNHPHLRHWAAENLDTDQHPLMSPLPSGMVYSDAPKIRELTWVPMTPSLSSRPLRVLCGHRVRAHKQWDKRKAVTNTAKSHWSDWCTILDDEVPELDFLNLVAEHSFVLCAEGGGLSPSPKAWQAILHGAIPIIKQTTIFKAYAHLPVVFVDDWSPESLSLEKLTKWRDDLGPYYDVPEKRNEVLNRLGLDYWWDYISGLPDANGVLNDSPLEEPLRA
jgi:hypothetical protein